MFDAATLQIIPFVNLFYFKALSKIQYIRTIDIAQKKILKLNDNILEDNRINIQDIGNLGKLKYIK